MFNSLTSTIRNYPQYGVSAFAAVKSLEAQ
jgi:hypothetical protein